MKTKIRNSWKNNPIKIGSLKATVRHHGCPDSNRTRNPARAAAAAVEKKTVSEASLKLLALEGKSIAQAEEQFGNSETGLSVIGKNKKKIKFKTLNKLFAARPELKKAWERGVFLRRIADYAATAKTIAEAGIELRMGIGELEKIFAADTETAEIWNQSRHKKRMQILDAFMNKAVESCSINAIKQMDKLLTREIVHPIADFTHITTEQLMAVTRKSRQTLQVDWPEKGLSRNSDATFNLFTFFPWFEDYIIKTKSRKIEEINPTQDQKARRYKLLNDKEEGRLLDRTKIITGLVARDQIFINIFTKNIETQNEPYIKQILIKILEGTRRELVNKILEMKLNDQQSQKLKDLLDSLIPVEVES